MRAGGGVGREEREAAAAAAAAKAEAAAAMAAEKAEAAAKFAKEEAERGDGAAAAAAAAQAAAAKAAAAAAALAAASVPSSSSSSSPSAADTSAPGSETSPRDARRYLQYLRALDAGFRGEYMEWLLKEGGGESEGGEGPAAAGGVAASLLSTTPAPRSDSSTLGAETPVSKKSTPTTLLVEASPRNASAWAAGRCLALVEGGSYRDYREEEEEEEENDGDAAAVVAFLNVGPLLSALEGMGVSNARIEVEAAGGAPGSDPLPRVAAYSKPKRAFFKKGEKPPGVDEQGYYVEEEIEGVHPSLSRTSVELPVTDGSALQWAAEIASVGLVTATLSPSSTSSPESSAPAPKSFLQVSSSGGGGFVSLYPEPEETSTSSSPSSSASSPYSRSSCRVSVGIDAGPEAAVVGAQWLSWNPNSPGVGPSGANHFRFAVAPARDWAPSEDYVLELRARRPAALYRGGTHGTTLIAKGGEWDETHRCRFVPDEPARNAVAAAVGALALLSAGGGVGIPRRAHVVAFNADAGLWVDFVRAVEAEGSERVALG